MPTAYFDPKKTPPPAYRATTTDAAKSCSFTTVTARKASNGNRPIEVVFLRMYLSGNGASRTVTLNMSGNIDGTTGQITIASASSASSTGNKNLTTTAKMSNTPYTSTVTVASPSGPYYLGNDLGGSCTFTSRDNGDRQLWGEYGYYEVPATPTIGSVTADTAGQKLTVSWSATSDWGGGTVGGKGYLIRISKSNAVDSNGNFTTTFTTANAGESDTSVDVPIADNTGATYYAQVYAYNQLSSLSGGPKSIPSATKSVYLGPAAAAPAWSDSMSNTARVGIPFGGSATASSSTTLTLSTPTNTLSTYGLSISQSGNTYSVSGRPTKSGTATLTMRAEDTYGQTTDLVNNIAISAPLTPSLSSTSFTNATANQLYTTETITANYASSISYEWRNGASPGMSVSTSSNTTSEYAKITLSGTPSTNAGGTYYLDVSMTGFQDGTSTAPTADAVITLYVNALPVPSWTDTTIDTVAAINQQYSSNISATNANSYGISGNPQWLSINTSTGELSGTPTYQDLTYGLSSTQKEFTVSASNAVETIEQVLSIDVVHPIKIFKDSVGDFIYPSSQLERFDQVLNDFVPVQWIKRYNDATGTWDHVDLI